MKNASGHGASSSYDELMMSFLEENVISMCIF